MSFSGAFLLCRSGLQWGVSPVNTTTHMELTCSCLCCKGSSPHSQERAGFCTIEMIFTDPSSSVNMETNSQLKQFIKQQQDMHLPFVLAARDQLLSQRLRPFLPLRQESVCHEESHTQRKLSIPVRMEHSLEPRFPRSSPPPGKRVKNITITL